MLMKDKSHGNRNGNYEWTENNNIIKSVDIMLKKQKRKNSLS